MILHFFLAFAVPTFLALVITPWVIRFAHAIGALDQPNERKAHRQPMPRIGGVAVFASFFISLGFFLAFDPYLTFPRWIVGTQGLLLMVSLVMVVLLGVWDDLKTLRPSQKFVVQILLSSTVYFAGFRISGITHPFMPGLLNLGVFDYLVTVLWIVGVTNAINLIDGLDGLASGVSAIAALTTVPIAILHGEPGTAVIALILAGAVLGFLRYNFNPAKIFLGDSGSLFLGFMLAVLSTQSSTKSTTAFSILVPILALGLPIMDTLLSMLRRLLRSFLPNQTNSTKGMRVLASLFRPDRGHIHHRLMDRGLSHRKAVLTLYVVSCSLGAIAFAVTIANDVDTSLVLLVVGIATLVGVRQLRYQEMAVLKNGLLLSFFELDLINRNLFHVFLDVAFIIVAYALAYIVTDIQHIMMPVGPELVLTIILTCAIQFGTFWSQGIYKGSIRQLGISDALNITRASLLGVGLTGLILSFLRKPLLQPDLLTMVLDFYFLLSAMLVSRFSFRVLNHLFQRETSGTRRVLIYGADQHGVRVLETMLDQEFHDMTPAGFLDDHPELEGKSINGYPVFGGHWKVKQLAKKLRVEEIILSSDNVKPEALRRLVKKAHDLGVAVRRFNMRLEEVTPVPSQPSPSPASAVAAETGRLANVNMFR